MQVRRSTALVVSLIATPMLGQSDDHEACSRAKKLVDVEYSVCDKEVVRDGPVADHSFETRASWCTTVKNPVVDVLVDAGTVNWGTQTTTWHFVGPQTFSMKRRESRRMGESGEAREEFYVVCHGEVQGRGPLSEGELLRQAGSTLEVLLDNRANEELPWVFNKPSARLIAATVIDTSGNAIPEAVLWMGGSVHFTDHSGQIELSWDEASKKAYIGARGFVPTCANTRDLTRDGAIRSNPVMLYRETSNRTEVPIVSVDPDATLYVRDLPGSGCEVPLSLLNHRVTRWSDTDSLVITGLPQGTFQLSNGDDRTEFVVPAESE